MKDQKQLGVFIKNRLEKESTGHFNIFYNWNEIGNIESYQLHCDYQFLTE